MNNEKDKVVFTAIREAVEAGILAIGGIEAIKSLSMFPSTSKETEIKEAA